MDKNLLIIYIISFLDLFAVGLIFPVLPIHLRSLGNSNFLIGALGTTYSTIQVLSGPVVGSWSDIRGKKSILVYTLTLCSLCYFFLGFTKSIYAIFACRILIGFSKHTQSLCKACIADIYPPSNHAQILGQSTSYGLIGFVVGPVIGGHLYELQNGFCYITTLTSFLFILNIVLTLRISIPINKSSHKRKNSTSKSKSFINLIVSEVTNIKNQLFDTNYIQLCDVFLIRFLFGLSHAMYFTNQSLYVKTKFNLAQKYIGYLTSFISFLGVLTGFSLGKIKEKLYKNDHSCNERLWQNFLISSISFICLMFSNSFYSFILFLIPYAIVSVILRNASMEMIIQNSDNSHQGSLSGTSNSLMSISRAVSPLLSGIFMSIYSNQSVIILSFLPSFIAMLICLQKKFKTKEHVN